MENELVVDEVLGTQLPALDHANAPIFQVVLSDMFRHAQTSRLAVNGSTSMNDEHQRVHFREHQSDLEAMRLLKLTGSDLELDPDYLQDLDSYASTIYQAELKITPEVRGTITDAKRAALKKYLDEISRKTGIPYRLAARPNAALAVVHVSENEIEIDEGLAALLPPRGTLHEKAFKILLQDIFEHGKLYMAGKTKWDVMKERSKYFAEHPEEYIYFADLITNGKLESSHYPLLGEGLWGFKGYGDYLTSLRISIPLKKWMESHPGHPYFRRFELLTQDSPDQS